MHRRILPAFLAICAATSVQAQQGPPDPVFELEGLLVTGWTTPRAADAATTRVTVLEGDALRAAGVTELTEALRSVPGLSVVQSGSFGAATSLFLRGGESDYVLVLVDGVQVNQPGGGFDFSSLSLDDVARIEVVRGPASALYGSDAMAGVVHVITRTGEAGLRAEATVGAGNYGRRTWSAGVRGGTGDAGYSLRIGRTESDGVLPVNNAFARTTLSAAARFAPDDATRVRTTLRVTDRTYHFPTDGSGAVDDINAFTYGDEVVAGVSAQRALGSGFTVEALVGLTDFDVGSDDQPDGPADTLGFYGFTSLDHLRRASLDARVRMDLEGAWVSAGGELEEERQRSFTSSLSQWGSDAGRSTNSRWNRALYLQAAGERGRLAWTAGGRLEDNERFGSLRTWQAGGRLAATVGVPVLLRASLGRGIKEPTFYENYATGFAVGNPDLDPERSRSWEVGVEAALAGSRLTLEGTWFDQTFDDLIQYTFAPPTPGGPNFYNVARARARGTEWTLRGVFDRVELEGGWTWLDSEVLDAGFDEGEGAAFVEGAALLRRPAHAVDAQLRVILPREGSVTLTLDRVGEREDRDFSTFPARRVTLPAYTLLGLGASAPLYVGDGGTRLDVTLRAHNLLDRRYEEVLGFPAPGRTFSVEARVGIGG